MSKYFIVGFLLLLLLLLLILSIHHKKVLSAGWYDYTRGARNLVDSDLIKVQVATNNTKMMINAKTMKYYVKDQQGKYAFLYGKFYDMTGYTGYVAYIEGNKGGKNHITDVILFTGSVPKLPKNTYGMLSPNFGDVRKYASIEDVWNKNSVDAYDKNYQLLDKSENISKVYYWDSEKLNLNETFAVPN